MATGTGVLNDDADQPQPGVRSAELYCAALSIKALLVSAEELTMQYPCPHSLCQERAMAALQVTSSSA